MNLSFVPGGGGQPDYTETTFGIRTVEMAPLPDGPRPDKFNWTFIINGEALFVKGTGWCSMDPLMDVSYERYDRFLTLAAMQHVQMLRGWGSGMPEADEFYEPLACGGPPSDRELKKLTRSGILQEMEQAVKVVVAVARQWADPS